MFANIKLFFIITDFCSIFCLIYHLILAPILEEAEALQRSCNCQSGTSGITTHTAHIMQNMTILINGNIRKACQTLNLNGMVYQWLYIMLIFYPNYTFCQNTINKRFALPLL